MNRIIKSINKRRKNRGKKVNVKTVTIVNKPPPLPPKPARYLPQKKTGKKKKNISPGVAQFRMSLLNPFDQRCNGVRVPDAGAFSTVPFHYRSELTVNTSSTNSATAFAFLPSVFCTAYFDQALSVTWSTAPTFGQNTSYYYYNSPGAIPYSTYRVVSGGINITCMLPELSATGRLIITPYPLTGSPLGFNLLLNQPASTQVVPLTILSGGSVPSSGMLALPSAYKITLIDLLRKPLLIPHQVESSTLAYKFKSAIPQGGSWNTTNGLVEPGELELLSSGSIITNTVGTSETQLDFSGWNAIYCYLEGVPLAATYSGAVLSIEHILHCEGVPNLTASAYSAADMRPLKGSTTILEAAIDTANAVLDNTTRRVFDAGMQSLMKGLSSVRLGSSMNRGMGILMDGEY
jgi:hypothetical protein